MPKIQIDGERMIQLAEVAITNGTQNAWISIACDWIKAADAEINRLVEEPELIK